MIWSKEAETALSKAPFFVRNKVRKKVEQYTKERGKTLVDLDDVNDLKQQYLSKGGMEKEIKGYSLTACFGNSGCPNRIPDTASLINKMETMLQKADLLTFLKQTVKGELKFHHEFRAAVADCPNACSRPQITDMGVIAAAAPMVTEESCTGCLSCVDTCREGSILVDEETGQVDIDFNSCVTCGQCINACPTGTIASGNTGYRVMLGGRLGRHPRLAMELDGLWSEHQVIEILEKALTFYKTHSKDGIRFAHLIETPDIIFSE
ncbi:MAG: 4Fe-4S binding protein [Desulfarculaceae bacterium]|nr:4Fe-4S binding protein [Desulfarculaceae bacterium]